MGIREQTYKISKIVKDPSKNVKDPIEILLLDENNENAENTNQPKLHEGFHFGHVLYCIDQSGKEYVYRNNISDIDNVDDLVKKFIENVGVGAGMKVQLEDRRLRFFLKT